MVVISTDGKYPFEAFCIPDKFKLKAEQELMETKENRDAALKQLREFILAEKDLIDCRTTDEYLLQFLRSRKFNIPRALCLVRKTFHFKRKNPAFFTEFNYEILSKLIKNKAFTFLPYRCEDGCAIFAAHLDRWNPNEVGIEHLKKIIALMFYHSIWDPLNQVNGYKVLFNVKTNPLKHLRHLTPQNLYQLYAGTLDCFPGRFKSIHVINMSLTFKAGYALVYPFLSEKLKNRVIFHENNDTLLNYFSESILPVDFGGQLKDYDNLPWLRQALSAENLKNVAS